MTLQTIAENIAGFAAEQLAQSGLTVVPVPSEDPSEDHAIEFRDGNGRVHAVSVQVNSLAPSWANSSLTITHVAMEAIEGTRYSSASPAWSFIELRSNSRTGRIEEIMAAIAANNWFVPVDDLEAGIVTDFRMKSVVPKLMEHFDGEVRLSRSGADTDVDNIEIVEVGREVGVRAALIGPAQIHVTYTTLAGDERVLDYDCLVAFEKAVDRDLGGRPAQSNGIGPGV